MNRSRSELRREFRYGSHVPHPIGLANVKSCSFSLAGLTVLVTGVVLGLTPVFSHAEADDDRRLRQLAGQAASYAGEVRALLAKGADPNVPDRDGRTAVHGAARLGALETLAALLEAGGTPDRRDEDGNTPLHFAADASQPTLMVDRSIATIHLLLNARADADAVNAEARTPLHLAAGSHDRAGGVAALLSKGADPNRKNRQGNTPLHVAVGPDLGWPGVVRALLDGGAGPRTENGDGLTALQLFIRAAPDRGDTVAILIDAGADPDRKYPNGDAPLHAAIRSGGSRGKVGVSEALLAAGADPCIRDACGFIPYSVAREGGEIHRTLDRAGGYERACDEEGEAISLDSSQQRRIQMALADSGFDPGPADGEFGPRTRRAIEAWQQANGHAPTGELTSGQVGALLDDSIPVSIVPFGSDWIIVENQPCQIYNAYGLSELTVTWSGACVDGKASGRGRTVWRWSGGKEAVIESGFRDGKIHGHGSLTLSGGSRYEGEWRDGKQHGHGVYTKSDGTRYEGEWRDGCFEDDDVQAWVGTTKEACGFE